MQPRTKTFGERFQRARLDELSVLVEVAESGSLSAAAKRLRAPKSTVGRAIRRLEEDLGVSLVRRMSQRPALTESGRVLADMAAPHITALRDVPAALGRTASEAYGVLRITTLPDLGSLVLAPLLPGFLARIRECVRRWCSAAARSISRGKASTLRSARR
jgi:DNA-binding transcriptional LysR family regulator